MLLTGRSGTGWIGSSVVRGWTRGGPSGSWIAATRRIIVSLALQAPGLSEAERTATYRALRHQPRAGRSREAVATLRRRARARPLDPGGWAGVEFLDTHEAHLRYDRFGYRGRPRAAARTGARSGG